MIMLSRFVLVLAFFGVVPVSGQSLRVDMHAHPSRFHRSSVPSISVEEVERYLAGGMQVVVCNISSDTPYRGNYILPDGTEIASGRLRPAAGEVWRHTLERFTRLEATNARADAIFVSNPTEARKASAEGRLGMIPALEGADALEGDIARLKMLYGRGLRLLQLVHFRANEIGHIQTWPYTPGGLTDFGREVVETANRLGIVIDLAHANSETIGDILTISEHPVIFSHTGVFTLVQGDRYLGDDDIKAIASKEGVIGIWPNGSGLPSVDDMAKHIAYVRDLVGIKHVGIGSDLRGMGGYSDGFGDEANFLGIVDALRRHGFDDTSIELVMGGNFTRVWEVVTK